LTRASAFTFKFRETTKFREKFSPRSRISRKRKRKKGPENKKFFDFAVNIFFKACCFSGNVDVKKLNADALLFDQQSGGPGFWPRKNAKSQKTGPVKGA
jgi:hypothetical protein